jgi:hypothetical protein
MIPSSRILDKAGKALERDVEGRQQFVVGRDVVTSAMSSRLTPMRCRLSSIERRTPSAV